MPWFIVHPSGFRYPVGAGGLTLGRAPDNDVVLTDEEASRHHALVQIQDEHAWLIDRSSINGVYVNEQRIGAPQELQPGDVIRLGRTRLQTEYSAPMGATPAASASAAGGQAPAAYPPGAYPPAAPMPDAGDQGSGGWFWRAVALGAVIGLVGVIILYVTVLRPLLNSTQPVAATPDPTTTLNAAVSATAFLLAPIGDSPNSIASTGVVISDKGRLLAAYSGVYDPKTERPYNPRSQVLVGLSSNPRQAGGTLDRWYLARVVRADRQRDLAILQIYAQQDGSPLPNSFNWPRAPLGNAAAVQAGDAVSVLSYPGTSSGSGQALALGQGQVTGIAPDAAMGLERGWFQSNIAMGSGNLGAVALDAGGRVIGLYTGKPESANPTPGWLRPLDVATPLLLGAD